MKPQRQHVPIMGAGAISVGMGIMKTLFILLKPRLLGTVSRMSPRRSGSNPLQGLLLLSLGIGFWGGGFLVSRRVLTYFKGIEDIGTLLAAKLLSMVLVTLFALLFFSAILQSLTKLYLSKDLPLVHAFPVPAWKVFLARWFETVFDSSWMAIAFSLPFLAAYGAVFKAPFGYYWVLCGVLAGLSVAAGAISALLVLVAVMVIPANRMKNIFIFLGILLFIGVYVSVRMLKPEQLVDPEVFDTVMVYVASLDTPESPLLPTTWGLDALMAAIGDRSTGGAPVHLGLLWSFAGFWVCVMLFAAGRFYVRGVSRAQTAGRRFVTAAPRIGRPLVPLPGDVRALFGKEIKSFLRDQAQWSQLFLIGALILIYVYNFKVLPLEKSPIQTVYLQNLLGFLNMGLALFVLTAVTARFAFPAVSGEREAFWVVQSAPITLRRFLWVKFFFYVVPLLVLTQTLVVVTNLLLEVSPFMMWLSVGSVMAMVPGVVALGVGLGAAFPDFKAENPTQTVTGYGGVLYMILCAGFIVSVIVLEAGPVYAIFMADLKGRALSTGQQVWSVVSFCLCGVLCLLAFVLPMTFGARRLARRWT